MNCQKCNFQNEDTAKFCKNCGTELRYQQSQSTMAIKTCPKCNFKNTDNVQYCGKCGAKLTDFHKKSNKKKNYWLWILAGILIVVIGAVSVFFIENNNKTAMNDLKIANLRGNVKSVREITYNAENKFGELIKGDRYGGSDGKFDDKPWSELPLMHPLSSAAIYPFKNSLIKYEKNGCISDIIIYDENNQIDTKYIYKYDDKGKKLERAQYDDKGKLENKFVFNYEPNGQLNSMICSNYPDIYCRAKPTQFDKNGNITIIQLSYKDESDDINCKYDKNNNLIGFSMGGEETEVKYDNKNRITQDTWGQTYFFDNNGYLIKKIGIGKSYGTFIYSNHDETGNWTKAINEEASQIVERTIEYW